MESILTSIKKLLGIDSEYKNFDTDIIIYINSVFSILNQLGVGPDEGFIIKDETAKWTDYIPDEIKSSEVKSYIYMKVKLMFDPPINSFTLDSFKQLISEFEWRISTSVERPVIEEEVTSNE